jgi:hypothetical protein
MHTGLHLQVKNKKCQGAKIRGTCHTEKLQYKKEKKGIRNEQLFDYEI